MTPRTARAPLGLTLVEVIIVVLVLGVLTSMALPRALNLGAEARRNKAEGMHGRVRAAALISREIALNRRQTDAGPEGASEIELNGTMVQTNYGYPEASAEGIVRAVQIDPNVDLVSWSAGGHHPGNTLVFTVEGARANCEVSYRSPASPEATPRITLATSGC
jgi:MSHA pilin protein MshA